MTQLYNWIGIIIVGLVIGWVASALSRGTQLRSPPFFAFAVIGALLGGLLYTYVGYPALGAGSPLYLAAIMSITVLTGGTILWTIIGRERRE